MAKKTVLNTLLVTAVILLGMWPGIAVAGTIYVDDDASPGGDGTSWGTAYKYLQDALYKPPTGGDEIWVAAGVYKPDEDEDNNVMPDDRYATFELISGVALYGGFAGGETSLDERDWQTNETILSGDIGIPDANSDNSYHVVTGNGVDETAVLDGFTITAGNTNIASYPAYGGGGMCNHSGSGPTVTNCTFTGNSALCGGGMSNVGDSLQTVSSTVTNCSFVGNSASAEGGGMFNSYGSPTVTNCTFSGNSADAEGGGMLNRNSSSPTVTNCILWGNTAPSGAQIYDDGTSSVTVSYSDVQGDWSGTGNIPDDPLFADADLRLSPGSPCIDAGDNTAVPGGVTTDLDGNPRIINAIVDMGAYEYEHRIYVDVDATGANNGTSWANAFNFLQDALAVAVSGDEILVAQGTYYPDCNSVNPIGSGDQTATFQLINDVAIKGSYAGFGAPEPNERDVQRYGTILSGDIGSGGSSDNSYHVVTGSGTDATAVLDGFTITAGNADGSYPYNRGGGMYNSPGSPTVANCTFSGNTANDRGGGMYNENSSPTVTNCTFNGNSINNFVGGGMCNWTNSSPTVTNCTFSGNTAFAGGGMYNWDSSSPTVTNCAFSGNSADYVGGGMANESESNTTLTNCTFSGNSASDYGGGMYSMFSSSPTLTNCILWANTAPSGGPQIQGSATVSYSDVQGSWPGTENIDEDPLFIDPNGPDGIPGTADDEEGYVHLRGYSPCINAGDPAGNYSGQVDIDSQPRVAYGRVDMGADEVFPIAGDFEPDGDVDLADFAIYANNYLLGL